MWLLITFIIIWAVSPGPVAIMTLHESRKRGLMAGVAVSGGASLTALLMVIMGIIVHLAGFSAILDSDGMIIIERFGAFGIICMGLYAAYKSLISVNTESTEKEPNAGVGFVQGMLVMATYIPQALVFYAIVVPQTVDAEAVMGVMIMLGGLKVALIFGWHAMIAVVATYTQKTVKLNRKGVGKFFEIATACLIIGLGINILI